MTDLHPPRMTSQSRIWLLTGGISRDQAQSCESVEMARSTTLPQALSATNGCPSTRMLSPYSQAESARQACIVKRRRLELRFSTTVSN